MSIPATFNEPVPELDDTTVESAYKVLEELSRGLFPEGEIGLELLTWAESLSAGTDAVDARSLEERLEEAQRRFSTLVQQIPAVTFMAVLGEGANDVYVSPHIEQMLGYTQEEWLGEPFLWYRRLHPDDRMLWNDEFSKGCRTGGPFRAECRFLARDGHVVWVHGEARLVKDERGRPQFLQGVAFDITESKKAQEVLLTNAVRDAKHGEQMAIARRVQNSILPVQPALENLQISATTEPAEDIGGDYYDVRRTLDGGWITIGDVSGHGLDAGVVMLMVQSAALAISVARPNTTPSEMLVLLNDVIFENVANRLNRDEYVTLTVFRYHKSGLLTFAGAHQAVLVLRAKTGRVERVSTPGPWIGIRRNIRSITVESDLQLRDGDVLVLFTDGAIECTNAAFDQFDLPRLCETIEEVAKESPERIRDHVLSRVKNFLVTQDDDITLLVARYTAG